MTDMPLATLSASAPRRAFGVAVLFALGLILIVIPLRQPPGAIWYGIMVLFGIGAIVLGEALRRATSATLILTPTDLREDTGRVLAVLADVSKVNRGSFAMKPSNGFTLEMKSPQQRIWAPGLWWSIGRRVGVGGVVPSPQARIMAEKIEELISAQQV